jgi:hypothetical protein
MTTRSGPEYEKKRNLKRELEREVLSYLRGLRKPIHTETLQAHFEIHRSEDIATVLHDLKAGHYIALDVTNNVTITEIGLSRLRAAMF